MTYWRMQLHPADAKRATMYAVESVAAGFIGLDFTKDPGDLSKVQPAAIPTGQKDYLEFCNTMAIGDKVLVIVHHFPFALVTVAGEYNYLKEPVPELGVWFRHFRRIDPELTAYHADRITNARAWDQLRMTDTISPLKDPSGQSYKFIAEWLKSLKKTSKP